MNDESQIQSTGDVEMDAFHVWALLADRGYAATSRLMKERFNQDVKADTIQKWHDRHDWDGKALTLYQDAGPALFDRTRLALVAAGPPAATYLLRVVSGAEKPDRATVVAAATVLDRIGFLPFTRKDAERGATPMLNDGSDEPHTYMSDEQLDYIISKRLRKLADPSSLS